MEDLSLKKEELFEFASFLGQQSDYQEVVRMVAQKSALMLKADLALILMLNPDTRKTAKTIFKDGKTIQKDKGYRNIHIHVGGWIVNNKKSIVIFDLQNDTRFAKGLFDSSSIKSISGAPLIIEGIVIGAVILLYCQSFGVKNPENIISSLTHLATISAPFLRNVQKIREYFVSSLPESSLLIKYNSVGLFGKNDRFIQLLHSIEAAIKVNTRVLLVGKTGTGKELVAKAIHKFSSRVNNPFVAIDCGAIQVNLLESELFGHKRGAFTGATSDRKGLFQEADGGTLFMDEINNLPFTMQSKLLRVLQEGEIRPVGSNKTFKTDVRLIAASSVSLKQLVVKEKFREDLFYRLHVYPIYIPDLKERAEDIPMLAEHFLQQYAKQQNKKIKMLHSEVIDFIKWRIWDGNIRELENFVERIVTSTPENSFVVEPAFLPDELSNELEKYRENSNHKGKSISLKKQLERYETELIKTTLMLCNWNQSEAARILDTSESSIRYKMEKLKIQKQIIE